MKKKILGLLTIFMFLLITNILFVEATTVILNTSDNYIMEDTYIYAGNPSTSYGSASQLYIDKDDMEYPFYKINISQFNTTTIISNARLYASGAGLVPGSYIYIYHVYAYPKYNISGVEWNETSLVYNTRPTTSSEMNTTLISTNTIIDANGFMALDIKDALNYAIKNSDKNITIMLSYAHATDTASFYSKESSGTSNDPYLNVTYTLDVQPNEPVLTLESGTNKTMTNVTWNFTAADTVGLAYWLYGNNMSGSWVNTSWTAITGTSNYSSFSFNLSNATRGKNVCFQVFVNDSSNNQNRSNVTCLNVANTALEITDSAYDTSHSHNTSTYVDIGATDADNDTLTYYINDTRIFSINSTTGEITGYTTIYNVSNYSISVNVSDGTVNDSVQFWINITDTAPTLSTLTLYPTSPTSANNLTCNATGETDVDNDAITYYYEWYNNSVAQGINNITLYSGNLTTGDNWSCSLKLGDAIANGTKVTSQTVTIGGTESNPVINQYNVTSGNIGVVSNSSAFQATFNNTYLLFMANISDSTDKWTMYVCNSSVFNDTTLNCTSGTFLNSSVINSSLKQLNTTFHASGKSGSYNYWIFVVDNTSRRSAGSSGSFYVDTPPSTPTLNISSTQYYSKNASILVSSTDLESVTLNYTIWNSTDNLIFSLFNTTTTTIIPFYNMAEGTYYIYSYVIDEYYYNSSNSSTYTLVFDYTNPSLSLDSISNLAAVLPYTIYPTWTITDTNLNTSNCKYNLSLSGTLLSSNTAITCSGGSITLVYGGSYDLTICGYDYSGNVNCSSTSFTVTANTATPGGGSLTTTITQAVDTSTLQQQFGLCNNNGVCDSDLGETSKNCPSECGIFGDLQNVSLFNTMIAILVVLTLYLWYNSKGRKR